MTFFTRWPKAFKDEKAPPRPPEPEAAPVIREPAEVLKALVIQKYSPDQPRVPAGSPDGGQFAEGSGGGDAAPPQDVRDNPYHTTLTNFGFMVANTTQAGGSVEHHYERGVNRVRVTVEDPTRPARWQLSEPGTVRSGKSIESLRPALTDLAARNFEPRPQSTLFDPNPEEEPEPKYDPQSWEELKSSDQDRAQKAWMDQNRQGFEEQEADNWRSETAPAEARSTAADAFNDVHDWHQEGAREHWAKQVVQDYIDQRAKDGLTPVPFTAEQILNSMSLETDSDKLDNWSFRRADPQNLVEFSDAKLDTGQKTLPGIEPASALTPEMRAGLASKVKDSWDAEAGSVLEHMDVPDYITENVDEYMRDTWDGMRDRDRFRFVQRDTDILPGGESARSSPSSSSSFTPSRASNDFGPAKSNYTAQDFRDAHLNMGSSHSAGDPDSIKFYNARIGVPPAEFRASFDGGLKDSRVAFRWERDDIGYVNVSMLKDGVPVGTATRKLDFGTGMADSEYFKVYEQFEKDGIGKEMLDGNVSMYQKLGFKGVTVHANIDIGGYAWARYGYLPTQRSWDNDLVPYIREKVKAIDQNGYSTTVRDEFGNMKEVRVDRRDIPTSTLTHISSLIESRDPATVRLVAETKIGFPLLKWSNWNGTIKFDDKPTMDTFHDYVKKKKPKKKKQQ